MIPLKLTIEGIYSYIERQTIDFTELTNNGLFGILGGVGSGKSSILEAITYALYGETVRLNSRDRRSYNMMNLKSNRLYVELDFMNYDNNVFRATREIKRNSKNFEEVRPVATQFYQQKGGDWIPIEHSNAEQIIGLSYDNFRRTIIIPQGQFKEFLELGATERTNMMKDIFHLHRYDLQNKTGVLASNNRTLLDQIEGRLMEYELVNKDDIDNKQKELEELNKQMIVIKKEHELLDERYQQLKSLKDDFITLQKYKEEFLKKIEQQTSINAKQKQLETYERIFTKFDRLLSDLSREHKHLKGLDEDRTNESKILIENTKKLEELQSQLNEILPYYNQLSNKRKEEIDLELISQILDFSTQIDSLKERTKKGEAMIKDVNDALEQTIEDIKHSESSVKELANHRLDSQLLLSIDGWYLQYTNNIKSVDQHHKSLTDKQNELNSLHKEIEDKKIDINNFEAIYNKAILNINKRDKIANEQKANFELQQKMADYANALHDGEACPLCGSEEHPHIAGVEDVSHHIKAMSEELNKIKVELEQCHNYRSQAQRLFDKSVELALQIKDADNKLNIEKNTLVNHKSQFVWVDFNPDDRAAFDVKKEQSLKVEKQIDIINSNISKLRKIESDNRNNLAKYTKALEDFRKSEIELSAKIYSNKSHLKVLEFDHYKEYSDTDISKALSELKKKNDDIETQYTKLNTDISNIDKLIVSKESIINSLDKLIGDTTNVIAKLNINIESQLASEGYDNIKDVEAIIAQKIDIAKDRELISKFTIEFETLKNQINDLEGKLSKVKYDDSQFVKIEESWRESKQILEESNNNIVKLKSDLDRLSKLYKEKKDLIKEQEKLSKRAENLRVMTNLFKAQGFVQYVSSIYLADLCEHANERFRRMTRNQLRLQINENNDFEIVDYLNEGRTRSVKTLSGGQSFQVSLSLALALAESVQSNAKAEKNFFFIDEGFGTQDLDSVNIVFETLLSLNKENKIVGIISHVEELKERIPMTLTVVKDQDRGSLIN